ncbi:Nn.00g014870.m01.CDS01 [Neocucurbitaria sp. VM-36]
MSDGRKLPDFHHSCGGYLPPIRSIYSRHSTDIAPPVNDARAVRVAEIMTDFRNLQHYLVQLRATPTAEEYYLEGYSLLRQCASEAQTILQTPFSGANGAATGEPEREKQQLKAIITDAAVRRFQCQRAYLRAHAGLRWMNSRNSILRGQKPNASHLGALQQTDATLRNELLAITDTYVESTLRAQDAAQGKWLNEDPSLAQIQHVLMSRS